MPLIHLHRTLLRSSNCSLSNQRCFFLVVCAGFLLTTFAIGSVFMGLFLGQRSKLSSYNCKDCTAYNATVHCGKQACCSPNSTGRISFIQCANDTEADNYLAAAIVVYIYVFYEALYFMILECVDDMDYDDYSYTTQDIIVVDNQDIPMNQYTAKDDYINEDAWNQ